jgi:anti-sigma B factor antagonist
VSIVDVRVSVSRFGADSFVIAVGGELDLHTAEPLREKLADVLELGARSVLVDLTGVSFVDSTALTVLIDACQALTSSRGQMVLVADDPRILRVMELTGLDQVFKISPSLQEGVQALVGRRSQR